MMDDSLSNLQEEIDRLTRLLYTETTIDHAMNPRNVGMLRNADGWAKFTGPCGDTMEMWIRVFGDRIEEDGFWTDGCGTSIACGSMVSELAKGRSIGQCLEMTQEEVLEALGGLPGESEHCALLAVSTLKMAIEDSINCIKRSRTQKPSQAESAGDLEAH
jgi:nitrogen fixation NifU-like protein